MKILFQLLVFILFISTTTIICHTTKSSIAAATTRAMTSSIIAVGKSLWELSNKDNTLTEMQNYDIYNEILSMNLEIQRIFSDIPKEVVFKENLLSFERKIREIEYYYRDIVNYHRNYKSFSTVAKNQMMEILYNIMQFSLHGPVKLINELLDLLAFGSLNILNQLIVESYVSMKKLKEP